MIAGADDPIRGELLSGENLLWSGKPRPGFVLRSYDWFAIPFGLLFLLGGLMFAWLSTLPTDNPQDAPPWPFFVIFPLVFISIGSYFSFGHLLWARWVRSRSVYGLTDRRAIIVQDRLHRSVKTVSLKSAVDVGLVVGRDGVGTITFNESSTPLGPWAGYWMLGQMWAGQSAPALELIENARDVFKLIGEARAKVQS